VAYLILVRQLRTAGCKSCLTCQLTQGGTWINETTQPNIAVLASELGLHTKPQFTEGKKLIWRADSAPRAYSGDIPSLPLLELLDMKYMLWSIDSLAAKVDLHNPLESFPDPVALDSITLESFIKSRAWTQGGLDTADISAFETSRLVNAQVNS
jgi:hypothetical protein